MYAVIKAGGKQYRVGVGDVVYIEKLEAEAGAEVEFAEVLAVGDGPGLKVGSPYVGGAEVRGKVVKHGKNKKVTVFTYRPKKDSKRKLGHRQPYTKVEITEIKADKSGGAR
jgi:large subunit ribosomal protein L21